MSLRINHNISAINAHRNLQMNDKALSQSLEKLSSGLKINRAADGPASLVISEQMRAQIAGLNQAIQNSEIAVSMVQTTEAALNEVNNLLLGMRSLAIHAANEGVNDDVMLEADQAEITNMLATIDRISTDSQFGTKKLLDGTNGANGATTSSDLEFVGASIHTKGSEEEGGYDVLITQNATKSYSEGIKPLTQELVNNGETMTIIEGGRSASYTTTNLDTVDTAVQNLASEIRKVGLNIDVQLNKDGTIRVSHKEYGSHTDFQVTSKTPGLLSVGEGGFQSAVKGLDIAGTIYGEAARGKGQILTGSPGTKNIDGLSVRYTGEADISFKGPGGESLVEGEDGRYYVLKDKKLFAPKQQEVSDPNDPSKKKSEPILVSDDQGNQVYDLVPVGFENGELMLRQGKEVTKPDGTIHVEEVLSPAVDPQGNPLAQGLRKEDLEIKPVDIGTVFVSQQSLTFQVGANKGQTVGISLLNTSSDALSKGLKNESGFRSLREIDVRDTQGAQDSIALVDKAINEISSMRAELGAFQKNTLESNVSNLRIASENLIASESNIRDVDMAGEMAKYTRDQIMFNSATAMLAQANQIPQTVLQLLG